MHVYVCADYYDIVTSPMDLETIRMKVDEDAYPTLGQSLIAHTCILLDVKYVIHFIHLMYYSA